MTRTNELPNMAHCQYHARNETQSSGLKSRFTTRKNWDDPQPISNARADGWSLSLAPRSALEATLSLEGKRVSAITIQKILTDNGLGSKYDLWLAPEEKNAGK
ncbi:hypothetical protein IWQ51_004140 [Labrenzia sp. EL_142]|nr:hypothetical protein [Labrenzia sp. EL_142]